MSDALMWVSLLAIIAAMVALALPWLFSHLRRRSQARDPLQEGAYPVFSAETAAGREAEYINDQLPRKLPRWARFLAFFVLVAAGGYFVIAQWSAH